MAKPLSPLHALLDVIDDGVCACDTLGRIVYLNAAARRLLRVSSRRAAGRSLCGLLCADAACPSSHARCPLRRGKRGRSAAFVGRYPIGLTGGVDLRVRCLRAPASVKGADRLAILEDATAGAELERRKEDWRAMIAHDLRTPLSNFYSAVRTIQEDGSLSADGRPDASLLDICVRNCRRMTEMLDLYLDVARFDAGRVRAAFSRLDLGALVRDGVEEQACLARERGIKVSVDAPAGLMVRADRHLLLRAFQNVLNNALKFSPVKSRVDVSVTREPSGQAAIVVRDRGPGIPEGELPRIFERYYQSKTLRRRKNAGIGLGLAFCREAMTAMKGSLQLESRPGEGHLVTLSLPSIAARRPAAGVALTLAS